SFKTARIREQLENPASAIRDTWTTGEKPPQQYVYINLYLKSSWGNLSNFVGLKIVPSFVVRHIRELRCCCRVSEIYKGITFV
ncbi:hypothetical protein PanWU01x14_240810, partial [Parasponia andersonii]